VRIICTGWRSWPVSHRGVVWRALDAATAGIPGPIVVVQGECPYGGVDRWAKEWAEQDPRATSENHPAPWDKHGKAAGMIRNSAMVRLGSDLCLAFPGPKSRGTWNCLQLAVDADIPCKVYPWSTAFASGSTAD
jgi:hypothetical protein